MELGSEKRLSSLGWSMEDRRTRRTLSCIERLNSLETRVVIILPHQSETRAMRIEWTTDVKE